MRGSAHPENSSRASIPGTHPESVPHAGWNTLFPGVRCLDFDFEAVGPLGAARLLAVDAAGDVEAVLDTDRIEFLFEGSTAVDWSMEGRSRSAVLGPGAIATLPASDRHRFRFRGRTLTLNLVLQRDFLAGLESEFEGWRATAGLPPELDLGNPRLMRIGEALREELAAPGPASGLLLDGLSTALGVELARIVAGREPLARIPDCGAPRIDRVRAFIEDNLGRSMRLDELATVAGVSRSHLVRDFRRLTGKAPHQYVLARRIERAGALLAERRLPIVDIAYRLGFSSQSHFTTAFRKATGLTPAAFRAKAR